MSATVVIVRGPAGLGKTHALIERFRAANAAPGAALWIAPTESAGAAIAARLGKPSRTPNIVTLPALANRIVRSTGDNWRPISDLHQRLLLDEVIEAENSAGELRYFAAAARGPGFADAVFDLFAEFRARGISPDAFAEALGRIISRAKDRELRSLFARFHAHFRAHHLLDRGDSYARAAALLRDGRLGPFANVRTICVDGFVDFTPPQVDLLTAWVGQVEHVWLSLPADRVDELGRAELFQRAEQTARQFTDAKLVVVGRADGIPSDRPAGLAHLERNLFRSKETSADGAGVKLIEAPGELGEVRMVARSIKQLLNTGTAPESIVVTARSLANYADLACDVFAQYGIPATSNDALPLIRNPAVATLLRTWRLAADDFPFGPTTAFLRSSFLRPDWPEFHADADIAMRAEVALRGMGVLRGRDAYLRSLSRWAEAPEPALEDDEAQRPRRARLHDSARRCQPFLARFFDLWRVIPDRASFADHVTALHAFATESGIERAAAEEPIDAASFAAFFAVLQDWAELDSRFQRTASVMSAEAFSTLASRLALASVDVMETDSSSGVRILPAETVRAIDCDHLFILGLGERTFPDLGGGGPIYSEGERHQLAEAGLDLRLAADRLPDEKLLFLQLVVKPRRSLTLSYPAVDQKGLRLLRSSFLDTVIDAFAEAVLEPERRSMLIDGFDRDVPLCAAEERVQWALQPPGKRQTKAGDVYDNLRRVEHLAQQRFRRNEFTQFDGLLSDSSVRSEIASHFGPPHLMSPTALETYIDCPFKFFVGRVLGLEPLADPGESVEPASRGQVVHRALARLHRARKSDARHRPDESLTQQLVAKIDAAVAELAARNSNAAARELWRLEGRWLHRMAARYGAHWQRFLDKWDKHAVVPEPHEFERALGPLAIPFGGDEVQIAGRIDRIDVALLPDGTRGFWIIDYKTGSGQGLSATTVARLERVQLPLYAMMVEQLLTDARPLGMAYWLVATKGILSAMPAGHSQTAWFDDAEAWTSHKARLVRWVVELARSIRRGEFPLNPRSDDCTQSCDYGQVCRIAQSRRLGKTWDGPTLPDEHV